MPKAHHFCCFLGTPKKFLGPIYMFPRESFNKYVGYGYAKPTNLVSSLQLPRSFQAQFTFSQEEISTNTLDIDLWSLPTLWFLLWLPRISQAQFTCSQEKLSTNTLDIDLSSLPTSWFLCGFQEVPKLNLHALVRKRPNSWANTDEAKNTRKNSMIQCSYIGPNRKEIHYARIELHNSWLFLVFHPLYVPFRYT